MSQNEYSKRYQQNSTHLFDFGLYNVYDNNIINLSVGAPGPDLLGNCCEIFSEATAHRLVSNVKMTITRECSKLHIQLVVLSVLASILTSHD